MVLCWQLEPPRRPTFRRIQALFEDLMEGYQLQESRL